MVSIGEPFRMRRQKLRQDARSHQRIRFHYDVETMLARRLMNSDKADRSTLYTECYEELFRTVSDHPQLTNKHGADAEGIHRQLRLLLPMLDRESTLLEIGAGDCRLSIAASPHARKVIALDVAPAIMRRDDFPPNVEPCLSDGTSIPVPPGSVDVAYSNQLMEHLHPDDALEQVRNVFAALKPGGRYFCVTPNRLHGPHDVSRYFDDVATGLHLREYSCAELAEVMRRVGFRDVRFVVAAKGRKLAVLPAGAMTALERAFEALPRALRRKVPGGAMNVLFGARVVATK